MMRPVLPFGFVLGLCSLASALGALQVENATVGQRTLVITVDDSIKAPDLGKIQIEGYDIENAVFVEESDEDSVRLSPNFVDLTLPGNGRVLDFAADQGLLILDAPGDFAPLPGSILADTSFGGLLRKVVSIEGAPQSVAAGSRWTLRTVEAGLQDAVLDCDISFRSRVDLNLVLPDARNGDEVMGTMEDGTPTGGAMEYELNGGRIIFQPVVSGRIRISGGRVSTLSFHVQGDCEVSANLRGAVNGTGEFEYSDDLPGRAPTMIPIGHGLFVKVQNRPSLHLEAKSRDEAFSARAEFRVVNSLRGELGFAGGQWRPLADNHMFSESKSVREFSGSGEIKMSLKPRIEVLVEGVQGPAFTFEPYARFASTGSDTARVEPSSVSPPGPFGARALLSPPPGPASRELSLGSNVYMEARTTFAGPALTRSFLLFNHEEVVFSPPKEGTLTILPADSGRVLLNCETYPRAERYSIQQKLGNGPWETVLENVPGSRVRLSLKPSSQYRFRAVGFNPMGMSQAFPPEGIAYLSPAANRPPFVPLSRFPDSAAAVPDSVLVMSWSGGDPDPGSKVLYTVYLDTHYPPASIRAAGIADSSLTVTGLHPGTTYFWKVVASDGGERSESAVRSFSLKAPPSGRPEVTSHAGYPMALIPKGAYRREDGRLVKVGPLLMGKYEVTQVEFEKLMGRNPSYHLQDSLPVERVTWEEAATFCREAGGRLPTEAEWEYAARAGNAGAFWGKGDPGEYAWYRDNSDNQTQKVGRKKPNAWGLYDMAGNVFEWAQDWYGEYSAGEIDHPKGPAEGVAKVIRGASWYSEGLSLNLTSRYNNRPGFRNFKVGFRCAAEVENLSDAARSGSSLAAKLTERPMTAASASASEASAP